MCIAIINAWLALACIGCMWYYFRSDKHIQRSIGGAGKRDKDSSEWVDGAIEWANDANRIGFDWKKNAVSIA